MEVQQLPRLSASGDNERQEDPDVSVAPAKKRILVARHSKCYKFIPQEAMSIEEHVKEELNRYLGYNQPKNNSHPFEYSGNNTIKIFLTFPYCIAKKYVHLVAL